MTITTKTSLAAFCVLLFSLAGLGEARRVGCNSYSDSVSSVSIADAFTGSALSGNDASLSADYADSRWLQQDALQWPSRISARLSADNVHAQLGTTTRGRNSLGKRASKTYPRDLDMRPTPEPTVQIADLRCVLGSGGRSTTCCGARWDEETARWEVDEEVQRAAGGGAFSAGAS
ncbi:hypothetical protein OH76DRAFT_1503405 [Lentinus brumalis]|uniref:Uncharacterized protein n=1 Tax=Lentinus brumalis TaxID=2498619 RepID=A0A371DGG3_9APHY|nr:hypothetical protein OH76DRAFT_1503405 [Polyporus brumalis]